MTEREITIKTVIKSLTLRGFYALFAPDKIKAREMIVKLIPESSTIGIGDSATLYQIDIIPELEARGHYVVNPFRSGMDLKKDWNDLEINLRKSLGQDIFITGANAITKDGKVVSVDGVGNRVAGVAFGAKKVILVIGQNKIVEDLHAAFLRIKKVISPAHATNRGYKTPCVKKKECIDCKSKYRICNIISIFQGKPLMTDVVIILVGEDLGLGWDPKWPKDRINKIWNNYINKSWCPIM